MLEPYQLQVPQSQLPPLVVLVLEAVVVVLVLEAVVVVLVVPPETVTLKVALHEPPPSGEKVAVALHELLGYTVCSRDEPDVPQPLQLHDPPLVGCGPNLTLSPELTVTLVVCCQVPSFTWTYGVTVQPPPLVVLVLEAVVVVLVEPPVLKEAEKLFIANVRVTPPVSHISKPPPRLSTTLLLLSQPWSTQY